MADERNEETEASALEGGNYEIIRARLRETGRALRRQADALNERRIETFGSTELTVAGNVRVRTEHNCVPRDAVSVGGLLLFGYNVSMGMKRRIEVADVFSLHQLVETEDGFDMPSMPLESRGFLTDANFVREFGELYEYYKEARLHMLRVTETKLLAIFQIGAREEDVRVFRWAVDPGGQISYIDSRGERDHVFPDSHDFEWTPTTRDDHVRGKHPHISILDEVFVEAVGGDLTVKVEDNTEDGRGVYSEPVEDRYQSLDDADVFYAKVGGLILLKIKPFNETEWRHLIYNTRNQQVVRVDAIGQACVQLPEDHGIIFPGGYYLQTGDYKVFDGETGDLRFKRSLRAPNGEDVLYVFHRPGDGHYVLFPYNLIRKEVQNPLHTNGYSVFEDGRIAVFRAQDGPVRVHPMQIWQTPFTSVEFADAAPKDSSFLGRIGNAELVRGISDAYTLCRYIDNQEPTRAIYEELIANCTRTVDAYFWIADEKVGNLKENIDKARQTAELIIDEFEKVLALKRRAEASLEETAAEQSRLMAGLTPEYWTQVPEFLDAMTRLRQQRGHLITLKEVRYIDIKALEAFEQEVIEGFDAVSRGVVEFLLGDEALGPVVEKLDGLLESIQVVERTSELPPLTDELALVSEQLDMLAEVVGGLEVGDVTDRSRILEDISEVFARSNRVRAVAEKRHKEIRARESKAEFGAQFKLFAQSVSGALAQADTPERCDEQLSRLMLQLEELEAKFGEFDDFLPELATKREEVYEALSGRKQTLLDERQRRIQNLMAAADRILDGARRRAKTFKDEDTLNGWFAADPMVLKLRKIAQQLMELGDSVKSDELLSKLKSAQQDALRGLRDAQELFVEGGAVLKFGRHLFNVNTQALELTLVPRGDDMAVHLNGTDFYEVIDDPEFNAYRPYWSQALISEDREVYRGEYLAALILRAAEAGDGLTVQQLVEAEPVEGELERFVYTWSKDRYEEGYSRGIHDADAAKILSALLGMRATAGLLRFPAGPRAMACLFWSAASEPERAPLQRRARSLARLREALGGSPALGAFARELGGRIREGLSERGIAPMSDADAELAGAYLFEELAAERPRFATSAEAAELAEAIRGLTGRGRGGLEEDLKALEGALDEQLALARAWVEAVVGAGDRVARLSPAHAHAADEAAVILLTDRRLDREVSHARTHARVEGLLGQHARIEEGALEIRLDTFLARTGAFLHERVPGFRAWRAARTGLIERERKRLKLDEFMPRVMTSFVRNKLINDVYLHLIGDNLAKQMGAAGASKRTDLMGMLLLISPPGYGKTTLMEYVANRLGLVFMKVNGPALGHAVTSLDPSEAAGATARQEVEKINLAFEMGNNVMLYLDDIQHTSPELLQKFISLCDGQRKIEGVWRGRTRTYDLRGKKFCVVMAGNPYTETGEKFQIPDMLANRADTYNLGDVLDGRGEVFAMSYVENALTSNAVLAPVAARSQQDVYTLMRMADGEEVPNTELSHDYSAVERQEILKTLQHMKAAQQVLLQVNMEYIRSASQEDTYRTEPPFKLQGSYRNMNKLAEKIVPAMTDAEVQALITDHYVGESQTLTTGAEQNLLKLRELRGILTDEESARWGEIKKEFARVRMMGGGDDDPVTRITGALSGLVQQVEGVSSALQRSELEAPLREVVGAIGRVGEGLAGGGVVEQQLSGLHLRLGEIRGALAAGVSPGLAEGLGGIQAALLQGGAASAAQIEGLEARMDGQLQGVDGALRALHAAVERAAREAAERPVAQATGPSTPSPQEARVQKNADLVLRHAILLQIQRVLDSEAAGDRSAQVGEMILQGTLPVMQTLAEQISALVRLHLPEDTQGVFMDELRRQVAVAVRELRSLDGGAALGEP